jgi:hypothetical protein
VSWFDLPQPFIVAAAAQSDVCLRRTCMRSIDMRRMAKFDHASTKKRSRLFGFPSWSNVRHKDCLPSASIGASGRRRSNRKFDAVQEKRKQKNNIWNDDRRVSAESKLRGPQSCNLLCRAVTARAPLVVSESSEQVNPVSSMMAWHFCRLDILMACTPYKTRAGRSFLATNH